MIQIKPTNIEVDIVEIDTMDAIEEAWYVSRPNVERTSDALEGILKMDLPINELAHMTLVCKVPVLMREIITTMRDHIMWAMTSRNSNLTDEWEIYSDAMKFPTSALVIKELAEKLEKAQKSGQSQDKFRESLPLSYMTRFTYKVSLRSLGKLLIHLRWISRKYDTLNTLFDDFYSPLCESIKSNVLPELASQYLKYFDNVVSSGKHINYNEFTPFEGDSVTSNESFINMNLNNIPVGLRAQLVRSRSIAIQDNLLEAFRSIGWHADSTMKLKVSISSARSFLSELVEKRSCLIADADMWAPILKLLNKELGDQVTLPCKKGQCAFHKDCMERLEGRDCGTPCPMHYILHKNETMKVKILDKEDIRKIQTYVVDTNRCTQLVKASQALPEFIERNKNK